MRYEKFKQSFDTAMATIDAMSSEHPELTDIVNWLLSADFNEFSVFPREYAERFNTAEGFVAVLNKLQNSDELCFPVENGEPKIAFCQPVRYRPVYVQYGVDDGLSFLKSFDEFISAREEYELKTLAHDFDLYRRRHGLEAAIDAFDTDSRFSLLIIDK